MSRLKLDELQVQSFVTGFYANGAKGGIANQIGAVAITYNCNTDGNNCTNAVYSALHPCGKPGGSNI